VQSILFTKSSSFQQYVYPQTTALEAKKSRTFKDLETQIQGLSRTHTVFKYFQGFEFREKNNTFNDA